MSYEYGEPGGRSLISYQGLENENKVLKDDLEHLEEQLRYQKAAAEANNGLALVWRKRCNEWRDLAMSFARMTEKEYQTDEMLRIRQQLTKLLEEQ